MVINRSLLAVLTVIFFVGCSNKEPKPSAENKNDAKDTSTATVRDPGANPYVTVDVSPMDMSYFPIEYPKLKMAKKISTPPLARVIYSRPHLEGRHLFHGVQKYGEPWRLGANESTELHLYKDVTIQDKKVKAGRYVMYCMPQPGNWTIILNTNIDSWGLEPDSTKDVFRFMVPVNQLAHPLEYYTMIFEKTEGGADLLMSWDTMEARLPIVF